MIEIKVTHEMSKFDRIFEKCIDGYYRDKGKIENKTIFHYTSPDALDNILNRRYTFRTGIKQEVEEEKKTIALRFTKADSLNDKAEGQALFKIYHGTCKKLEKAGKIDDRFCRFLKSIENKDVFVSTNQFGYFIKECDTYICCFSEGKDLLPMWNYYSKNNQYEGYNLGFHFKDSDDLRFFKLNEDAEINMYRVIYQEKEIKSLLESFLVDLYQQTDLTKQYEKDEASQTVQRILTKLKYIFKNEAFSHEQEIRLILHILKNNDKYDIRFRTKNGIIIPYIELQMEREYLTEITIGPLIEEKIARRNLEFFLYQAGYKVRRKKTDAEGIQICSSKENIRY